MGSVLCIWYSASNFLICVRISIPSVSRLYVERVEPLVHTGSSLSTVHICLTDCISSTAAIHKRCTIIWIVQGQHVWWPSGTYVIHQTQWRRWWLIIVVVIIIVIDSSGE